MTNKELVSSAQIYDSAKGILDLHGESVADIKVRQIPRPSRPGYRGSGITIIRAPITSIELAGEEYRLWLQKNEGELPISLSVHYKRLPISLEGVQNDEAGHDTGDYEHTGYWFLPPGLRGGWFNIRYYTIKPDSIEEPSFMEENKGDLTLRGMEDGNNFVLRLLEEMQAQLKQ